MHSTPSLVASQEDSERREQLVARSVIVCTDEVRPIIIIKSQLYVEHEMIGGPHP